MDQQILEALTFYADPKSYASANTGTPDVMKDGGVKAKETLERLSPERAQENECAACAEKRGLIRDLTTALNNANANNRKLAETSDHPLSFSDPQKARELLNQAWEAGWYSDPAQMRTADMVRKRDADVDRLIAKEVTP